jgi:selenocysteine lyase/cysteine desulfurase
VNGHGDPAAAFERPAARVYADTANYGLPPRATVAALEESLRAWQLGSADWIREWDPAGDECRDLVAPFLGAPAEEISLLPAASVGVGLIAASLGRDDEIVIPDDEFRSVLFPILAAGAARGVTVRRVPFDELPEHVRPTTTLVATSHVRSNGGGVQDLHALAAAAEIHGARVLVDATHSAGVLPLDSETLGLHYVVAAAYKHLLCPRGVAFMRTDPAVWPELVPYFASWRSARAPYASFYGGDLDDLPDDARRFDVSLAWHPWVGARESLRFLASVEPSTLRERTVDLAARLARELGLEPTGSSIVGIRVGSRLDEAKELLRTASITASFPAGQIRISFHVYNDARDVSYVASVLSPFLDRVGAPA